MTPHLKESYQKLLYDFLKFDIEVVCPQCSNRALVKTSDFSYQQLPLGEIKLICASCGYNKFLSEKPHENFSTIGIPADPFFLLPLWLAKDWNSKEIWFYNKEHLLFVREHIQAKLRERNTGTMRNKSIGSRLPGWMTSANHREVVLKIIQELLEK